METEKCVRDAFHPLGHHPLKKDNHASTPSGRSDSAHITGILLLDIDRISSPDVAWRISKDFNGMDDLAKAIIERDHNGLLNELLFERVPHLFCESWDLYRSWRRHLSLKINVDLCEVIVIGSAAVGFSLSPIKRLKAFDEHSDVDVAVISNHLFSEAWHYLRTIDLTLDRLTPAQRAAVVEHQKRYVYWGCIATDRILPLLPFSHKWLEARSSLAGMQPTLERDINFRIYKDFRALRTYQLTSIRKLRAALLDPEGVSDAKLS